MQKRTCWIRKGFEVLLMDIGFDEPDSCCCYYKQYGLQNDQGLAISNEIILRFTKGSCLFRKLTWNTRNIACERLSRSSSANLDGLRTSACLCARAINKAISSASRSALSRLHCQRYKSCNLRPGIIIGL